MEHNSIKNLLEILKSQVSHYSLIRDTLQEEKAAVTSWNNDKIKELNKTKEQLSKKEKLLEEARKTISLRIKEQYNLDDDTVLAIIEGIDDECKDELTQLRDELLVLVSEISQLTVSLKVIYNTNLKIISDVKSKMGFMPAANKYGMDKSTVSMPSALQITG
ncbi:MAG: flagellar protein FlgN [Mucispirillum sp.]|nr:flagellar protein FlgN [Mucispirillum sp.]